MAAVSLGLVPETFTGEGKQGFSDWIDHFECIANVHGWDEDAKRKWIRARLNGRAAAVWRRLSVAEKDTYEHIVAALKKRFEPECKKRVYVAEFQHRRKLPAEDWVTFAEDLLTLVEKAYPTLQAEAQELLALNRFLDEIKDPQLAFGVRQRTPENLDQAVASTLELETYLLKMPTMVAGVNSAMDSSIVATAAKPSSESSLQIIVERLEKIEG